jgi:hypothetical protein
MLSEQIGADGTLVAFATLRLVVSIKISEKQLRLACDTSYPVRHESFVSRTKRLLVVPVHSECLPAVLASQ